MSEFEEECIHGLTPGTCTTCRDGPRPSSAGRSAGLTRSLDSPEALERYCRYYSDERQPTFEAYQEVFFRLSDARRFPGGWVAFSQCASAEPAKVRDCPGLVRRAEELMRLAGYEIEVCGSARGRRWGKVGD